MSKETWEQKHQLRKLVESYLNTILHLISHAEQQIWFPNMYVLVLLSKERGIGLRCDKVNSTHNVYQGLHMLMAGIYTVQMYLQVCTSKMFTAVQCHYTPSGHEFHAR